MRLMTSAIGHVSSDLAKRTQYGRGAKRARPAKRARSPDKAKKAVVKQIDSERLNRAVETLKR